MAFKFQLEALLRKNKYEEELAKKAFAEAQGIVTQTMNQIKQHQQDIMDTNMRSSEIRQKGGSVTHNLSLNIEFVKGVELRIERLENQVREEIEEMELRKGEMIAAVQESKKLEILKDKRLKEHIIKVKKKEQVDLDDILIMRNGRKGWG